MPAWADDSPPQVYVGASKPQMMRMAGRVADGVMMSDVTLPRIAESMDVLQTSLREHGRDESTFPVSNLYAWHIKPDAAEARAEARAKLFVRGMLEHWYVEPFLDDDECAVVEENFPAFAQAYVRNSPDVEGVPDALVDKLVDNLTWTGTEVDIDRCIEEMVKFRDAGVTELAIRLYHQPEDAMRLIADRVMPAFIRS
jgi:alkanesulfonate monooxygenase SsuD/methylene tetrahydromethanopterin reductase-like flavin-dependent oxidoreductase (luciferase family)